MLGASEHETGDIVERDTPRVPGQAPCMDAASAFAEAHIERFLALSRWYLQRDAAELPEQGARRAKRGALRWGDRLGAGRAWPARRPV